MHYRDTIKSLLSESAIFELLSEELLVEGMTKARVTHVERELGDGFKVFSYKDKGDKKPKGYIVYSNSETWVSGKKINTMERAISKLAGRTVSIRRTKKFGSGIGFLVK